MAKRKRHGNGKVINQGTAPVPPGGNVPRTLLGAFNNDTNALDAAVLALRLGQGLRVNQWGKAVVFKQLPHLYRISYSRRKE